MNPDPTDLSVTRGIRHQILGEWIYNDRRPSKMSIFSVRPIRFALVSSAWPTA
jgi:hypothetical protein